MVEVLGDFRSGNEENLFFYRGFKLPLSVSGMLIIKGKVKIVVEIQRPYVWELTS